MSVWKRRQDRGRNEPPKDDSEVPLVEYRRPRRRPRVLTRHRLWWEGVGDEDGARGLKSPESPAAELNIREPRERVLPPVGEKPYESTGTKLESATSNLVEETRRRLENEVRLALEAFSREVDSRLAAQFQTTAEKMSGELRALQTKLLDDAGRQLSTAVQKHLESLACRIEEMVAECRDQLQKELSEGARHGVQPLEPGSQEILEQHCESIQKLFDRRLAVAAEAYLESLNREAHVIVEKGRSRLRHEVDTAVLAVMPTLEAQQEKRPPSPPVLAMRPMELHPAGPPSPHEAVTRTQGDPRINAVLHTLLTGAVRLLPVGLILLFITLSIRPVMYLRTEPPPEFLQGLQDPSTPQGAEEEVLARAYWDSAVRHVQTRYEVGTTLPQEPPPDFRVERTGSTSQSPDSDSEARRRYWRKLRQVWKLPQAWEKSYVWDTGWALLQLIGAR